ncbi:response regulator [Corynebacterium flavescens]|uniref:response regulator n=1 Tax=Corynebacterium flavescens TaxID=28028 RepID=UPI002648A01B|nr:response regulator transcription factor [Corynebacterium flavescens]MDN6098655.1 response regulator transcription factor [Corynebacterium flavescens]MDN6236385.1 response regulator transcription factor [Corynebacterium flavescens]MDN6430436.1 response regulator transcription factor [Corynebacterium flavescens]MDN6474335.1 response regulator transcription factor [Corynebacterium flavescens]MDN6530630.1 response regulator transcription factor [Corynebacterium flavescens]
MISIGLVDDQQLVRAGFAMVIGSQDDLSVSWEASDGAQAIDLASALPVDVILMDVRMPGTDGITATTQIIAASPEAKVIVLTTFDNDEYVVEAIAAGASGFLLKDADPEELLHAVRAVAAGESVLAAASTTRLLRQVRPLLGRSWEASVGSAPRLPDPLTPREEEILMLVAQGLDNQEIADVLFISLPTVKTHIGHILAKTGSRNRVQAVIYAFRAGLVTGEELPPQ